MSKDFRKNIDDEIKAHTVLVYSKTYCPYCVMAKKALDSQGIVYKAIELDELSSSEMESRQDILKQLTGARSVPRVFIKGECIGGGTETAAAVKNGTLKTKLNAAA